MCGCVCVCIFYKYKQALRGADSDPDSRADKNSSQSIIRFMNIYVYLYIFIYICIVMYKKFFAQFCTFFDLSFFFIAATRILVALSTQASTHVIPYTRTYICVCTIFV